jgi:ribosomal RNA-processing protein 36
MPLLNTEKYYHCENLNPSAHLVASGAHSNQKALAAMPAHSKRKFASEEDYDDKMDLPRGLQEAVKAPRRSKGWSSESSGSENAQDSASESEGWDTEEDGQPDEESEVPLGQLLASRQDGAALFGPARRARQKKSTAGAADAGVATEAADSKPKRQVTSFKRVHKHRPSEQTSKRPVSVFRDTMQAGKREIRDPRFQTLTAGAYVDESFKKRYAFLYDEKLPEEKKALQEALKKAKSTEARQQIKSQLASITQQVKAEEVRRRKAEAERTEKASRKVAVAEGKQVYYLKKSERRKQELIAKYEELQKAGKLEKFMEKRRKKNAAKDHRYLPGSRRGLGED